MKKLFVIILIAMLACTACGKAKPAQEPKNTPTPTAGKTEPISEADAYNDDGDEKYTYPEGDYGEGFNYGKIRGKWLVEGSYSVVDRPIMGNDQKLDYMKRLITALGMEYPETKMKLVLRFVDESHMEGRITLDERAMYDLAYSLVGTKEGLQKLYGAIYGYSKNEVAYAFNKAGISLDMLEQQVAAALQAQSGGRDNYLSKLELGGTYTLSDGKILFDDSKLVLEFDEEKNVLRICTDTEVNSVSDLINLFSGLELHR